MAPKPNNMIAYIHVPGCGIRIYRGPLSGGTESLSLSLRPYIYMRASAVEHAFKHNVKSTKLSSFPTVDTLARSRRTAEGGGVSACRHYKL